ncbi:unnamed protein product [Prunus armeniaca]|uniref:Uncharacterized protein n=1 Tax=Prunus armeniaca TaxID=36596 RepID=A0A6J5XZY4_PRUAR|nr:unnamed protein product [Prunus armeniaca]
MVAYTNLDKRGVPALLMYKASSSYPITAPSPLVGLPEFSHLGWGHWFTLRDLEVAVGKKKNRGRRRGQGEEMESKGWRARAEGRETE